VVTQDVVRVVTQNIRTKRSFLQKTPKVSLTLAFSSLNRDPYNWVEIWNTVSEIHVSVLLTIYYYLGKYAEYPVTFSTFKTSLTCRGINELANLA